MAYVCLCRKQFGYNCVHKCHNVLFIVDDHHEVLVKTCLQAGYREYLAFSLNETVPYSDDCGIWILETIVKESVEFACFIT